MLILEPTQSSRKWSRLHIIQLCAVLIGAGYLILCELIPPHAAGATRMKHLRFGTRDLLWAMIVTGLVLVFLLHRTQAGFMRQQINRQQRELDYLTDQLDALGYKAEFDESGRPRYFGPKNDKEESTK